MAAKIILHEQMSEKEFLHYTKKWDKYPSVIIYIEAMDVDSRYSIFEMAMSNIPNSFAEAVIDIFLEDEDFSINDNNLIKCIDYGGYGLKRSVFYRKGTPDYIRMLCDEKNNTPN